MIDTAKSVEGGYKQLTHQELQIQYQALQSARVTTEEAKPATPAVPRVSDKEMYSRLKFVRTPNKGVDK